MATKICKTCGVEFDINKWQTKKVYCNDACKPTFRPNRGKPRGRPKDEWKEVFERYDIQTPLGTTGSYNMIFNLSQGEKHMSDKKKKDGEKVIGIATIVMGIFALILWLLGYGRD